MKVLVIRLSSIGDIVLCSPIIRLLKSNPETKVHFLTKKKFEPLVSDNPFLDAYHLFDGNLNSIIRMLKDENYDYLIDLHHNLRTFRIKSALKIPSRSFYKANIEKWLKVSFKIDLLPKKHIVDRYMETIAPFGIKNDGKGLDFFYKKTERITEVFNIPHSFVAVVLGGAHKTKQIPVTLINEIIKKCPLPIVLLGGKDVIEQARKLGVNEQNVLDLCGKLSIQESAQIIDQSECVITGDTGMMHIAAALKKAIISIWGSTIPAFGMEAYYGNSDIKNKKIEVTLKCRPCSKTGYKSCPRGHFHCMKKINAEIVLDALKNIL